MHQHYLDYLASLVVWKGIDSLGSIVIDIRTMDEFIASFDVSKEILLFQRSLKHDHSGSPPQPTQARLKMMMCEYCEKSAGRESLPFPDCNYCSASPSYHHGRCCPHEPSFQKDSPVTPEVLNPQISKSIDEQTQELTNIKQKDHLVHEVNVTSFPNAGTSLLCFS